MIPGKKELRELIGRGLIEDAINVEEQLQENGFDLTVAKVERFACAGAIGRSNKDRKLPESTEVPPGNAAWWSLKPGSYRIIFNETVSIPKDMCAIGRARSSLLRSGVAIHSAVWDAGYRGKSESLLVVHNPDGFLLQKDARVLQLIFMGLDSEQEGYSGVYQGERVVYESPLVKVSTLDVELRKRAADLDIKPHGAR